jgi:hypothetical protein
MTQALKVTEIQEPYEVEMPQIGKIVLNKNSTVTAVVQLQNNNKTVSLAQKSAPSSKSLLQLDVNSPKNEYPTPE